MAKRDLYKTYVGLTDDPARRKEEHGNPRDWSERAFASEREARAWEETMLRRANTVGAPGGAGWRFGYTYTIMESTAE